RAELARVEAEKSRIQAEKLKAEAEYKTQMTAIQKEMNDKLASAKSDQERARIRAEAAQAQAQAQARHSSHSPSTAGTTDKESAPKWRNVGKHEISDNPIEGL